MTTPTAVTNAVQLIFNAYGGKGRTGVDILRGKRMGQIQIDTQRPLSFGGKTFDAEKDGVRLTAHMQRVYDVMKDGQWRTLERICRLSKPGSEASCSSRIRDLRKKAFGSHIIDTKRSEIDGVWLYRMVN